MELSGIMGFRPSMGGLIRKVSDVVVPELLFRRREDLSIEETGCKHYFVFPFY